MRILVIDDDQINREIVSRILQSERYQIIEATNGQDGYRFAYLEKPDLIITDYHMAGLNGKEMIIQIKGTAAIQNIPIIAITADMYARRDLMNVGCTVFITKPIRRGSLLHTVDQVLAKHN